MKYIEQQAPSVASTRVVACGEEDNVYSKEFLPAYLQGVYDNIVQDLNEVQQSAARSLLKEFSNVLSTGPGDIGRTGIVAHQINTGDSHPLRQPARRLPLHKRQEAQREVEKMLERGIIEPSYSPWASPIVLIQKSDGSTRFCIDYRRLISTTTD